MASRVKFNIGEGVVAVDLNDSQALTNKTIGDNMIALSGSRMSSILNGDADPILRPIGLSGAIIAQGTTAIGINGGTWVYLNKNTPTATESSTLFAFSEGYQTLPITSYAGLGAQFRRDIVQTRLVVADGSPETRNTKDNTTGAITSASLQKRTLTTVEHTVKQGTPAATAALALEAAPDAGWTKIGSVLVNSSGITDPAHTYDWRVPVGDRSVYVAPNAMMSFSNWSLSAQSGAGGFNRFHQNVDSVAVTTTNKLFAVVTDSQPVADGFGSMFSSASRVMSATIDCVFSNDIEMEFLRYRTNNIMTLLDPTGTFQFADVSARAGAGGTYQLLNNATYPADPPVWTNGSFSALGVPNTESRLVLSITPKTLNDKVYGVVYTLAG